jgi:D-amino peptidase
MKVYIMADQEGTAGQFCRAAPSGRAPQYQTMELRAICAALLANGVTDILLNTTHAIEFDEMPDPVMILHGLPRHDIFTDGLDASFDMAFITGMHAMAGGKEKGCWRHTVLPHSVSQAYSSLEATWINDWLVGEIGFVAAFAGIHGVPVTLVTGDWWACEEAREFLPEVETCAVKRGTSYFSAISMTPQAAARASAEAAVRALAKAKVVAPVRIEGPVTWRVRYLFPERAADAMAAVRGCERIDERTVCARFDSLAELRDSQGNIRAPELPVFSEDAMLPQSTGFFTRLGPEPYRTSPTYPVL